MAKKDDELPDDLYKKIGSSYYDSYNSWARNPYAADKPNEYLKDLVYLKEEMKTRELELDRRAVELGRERKDVEELRAKLEEQKRLLDLSPDTRLKRARKIEDECKARENEIIRQQNELAALRQALNARSKQVDQMIRDTQEKLERLVEKHDLEHTARMGVLESEFDKKKAQLDNDYALKVSQLQNEEQRLQRIRHELSDREATITAREHAAHEVEVVNNAIKAVTGKVENRMLEL